METILIVAVVLAFLILLFFVCEYSKFHKTELAQSRILLGKLQVDDIIFVRVKNGVKVVRVTGIDDNYISTIDASGKKAIYHYSDLMIISR